MREREREREKWIVGWERQCLSTAWASCVWATDAVFSVPIAHTGYIRKGAGNMHALKRERNTAQRGKLGEGRG